MSGKCGTYQTSSGETPSLLSAGVGFELVEVACGGVEVTKGWTDDRAEQCAAYAGRYSCDHGA